MDYDAMTTGLGRAIKSDRIKLGHSQEKFARRASLHRTYISDIEGGGRNVSLRNLLLISNALRKPLSELIAEAEEIAALPGDD